MSFSSMCFLQNVCSTAKYLGGRDLQACNRNASSATPASNTGPATEKTMTTYFIVDSKTNESLGSKKDKSQAHDFAKTMMNQGKDCTVVTGTKFAALRTAVGKLLGGKPRETAADLGIKVVTNGKGVSLPAAGIGGVAVPVSAMPAGPKVTKAPAKAEAAPRVRKSTAAEIEAARAGTLPKAPDFSAETHKRFRKRLAEIVALVNAKDINGLRAAAESIKPVSTSPRMMKRYADNALTALQVAK